MAVLAMLHAFSTVHYCMHAIMRRHTSTTNNARTGGHQRSPQVSPAQLSYCECRFNPPAMAVGCADACGPINVYEAAPPHRFKAVSVTMTERGAEK
jgi:hypothetical protein